MAPTEPTSVSISFRDLATFAGRDTGPDRCLACQASTMCRPRSSWPTRWLERSRFDDADLVIDLSEVEFMSAATVGIIVRAGALLRALSRSLTLASSVDVRAASPWSCVWCRW